MIWQVEANTVRPWGEVDMLESGQTVEAIYAEVTRCLSLTERLKLASLLLNDIAQPGVTLIDRATSWSEVDQQELAAFAWHYAATAYPDEDEAV